MELGEAGSWSADWLWSLPLIIFNVTAHVWGLTLIDGRMVIVLGRFSGTRSFMATFTGVMALMVLLATALHALEALVWAFAYRFLDALPSLRLCMLYSLSAITSYGHASLYLESHWQLMGALEALNGMLLFGLTTAFLFAMIQKIWAFRKENSLYPD